MALSGAPGPLKVLNASAYTPAAGEGPKTAQVVKCTISISLPEIEDFLCEDYPSKC